MAIDVIRSDATFSDCGLYRYTLRRTFRKNSPYLLVIGLNPSTADAKTDDPTIRRCMTFAHEWGYGELIMVNLFAWRDTSPKDMMQREYPIDLPPYDPDRPHLNDVLISQLAESQECGMVLAAWGNSGGHMGRSAFMLKMLEPITSVYCLKVTQTGQPQHPLYIRSDTVPFRYWGHLYEEKNAS